MARWKPLGDGADPPARDLIVCCRELKDRVEISTARLARKTTYSKSSWDRYLNGVTLPPRRAVEELGQLAGSDLPRLLVLWELADQAQGIRRAAAKNDAASAGPQPEPGPGRRRWIVVAATGMAAVAATLGVTVWLTAGGGSSPTPVAPAAGVPVLPAGYACDYTTRDGHVYAGHSTTSDRLVALNAGSEDVIEVQCLLVHHGFAPGRIDGLYGRNTEQAVKQLQSTAGAVPDGIVGSQTWALLRS